jgi:ankyrin repeat protein
MLLANHADLEIIDVEGKTPCHTFFNSTTGQLFLSMREEVRNIITLDNNGMSIAHYAAWSSHSQPSHLLSCIEADDINSFLIRDHLGRSILHFAAQRGNLALLQYVLSLPFRLDVNCKDVFGQTSLHYATESRRVQAIDLLLTSGAKIDAVDLRGRSPMHRAASKNNTSAIDCIIRYTGIEEVARLDFEGNSPAQVAHAFGSKEAAEHLNGLCNESLRSRQPESPHTLRNNVTGPQRWTLGIEEVLRNIRRVITWRSLWSGSFIVVVMWFVLASDRSH